MADKAHLERMSREFTDQGKLIEAGWIGLRLACFPPNGNAPADQLKSMREAFFAGAQHLFGSMMTIMDPDAEPTEKDLERMSMIHAELDGFLNDFMIRNIPTEGHA
jgi:hypothetical protein